MWVRWSFGFALALALAACGGGGGVPQRVGAPPAQQPPGGRAAPAETPPITITVGPGETVASLADRHRVSIRDLIDANRLEPPYQLAPGQTLLIPGSRSHRVVRGDTLYGIARQYRTDLPTLARLNRLGPPYNIYEGQSLRIPATVSPPAQVTMAAAQVPPSAAQAPSATQVPPAAVPATGRPGIEVAPVPVPAPQSPSTTVQPLPPPAASADPPSSASRPEPVTTSPPAATSTVTSPPMTTQPAAAPPAAPPPAAAPQMAALPPARAGSLLFSWPVKGRILSGFGPKPGGQHNDGINIEVARGSPVRAAEAGTVVYAGNELKGYGNLVLIRHAGGWVTAYAHNDEILVRRGAQIGKGHLIAKSGSSGGVATPQVHFEIRRGRDPVDPMPYLGSPQTVSGAAGRAALPGPG